MKRLTALVLLVIGPSMAVNAAPTLNPATGHSYLVVAGNGISWADAKAAATLLADRDVNGHLATITSAEEFAFVEELRQQAVADGVITQPQAWIGGSQLSGQSTPGAGWAWENSEGTIPGADSVSPYANWAAGEPNDAPVAGENNIENHLTLGRYPLDPGFNDEGSALSSIGGYIVEFEGGTVAATTCTDPGNGGDAGTEPGCNPSGVVRYVIPAGALNNPLTDTVTAGLVRPGPKSAADVLVCPGDFVYRDPRVANDGFTITSMVSLDVFSTLGGTAPNGDNLNINEAPLTGVVLTLDKNTYGSPCFAIVLGTTDGFDILTGTVLGRQLAEDVPGIGNIFSCNRGNGDLQKRTQYTYMTTDPAGMAEGGAAAMTSDCQNPTLSTTKKKSFDVLNTHESCGITVSGNPTTVPTAVRLCFDDLVKAKVDLLEVVLMSSKPALNSPKFSTLANKFNTAKGLLKLGPSGYQKSQDRFREFLTIVNGADFDEGVENFQGDLIMRTNNVIFRLQELKCPAGGCP